MWFLRAPKRKQAKVLFALRLLRYLRYLPRHDLPALDAHVYRAMPAGGLSVVSAAPGGGASMPPPPMPAASASICPDSPGALRPAPRALRARWSVSRRRFVHHARACPAPTCGAERWEAGGALEGGRRWALTGPTPAAPRLLGRSADPFTADRRSITAGPALARPPRPGRRTLIGATRTSRAGVGIRRSGVG